MQHARDVVVLICVMFMQACGHGKYPGIGIQVINISIPCRRAGWKLRHVRRGKLAARRGCGQRSVLHNFCRARLSAGHTGGRWRFGRVRKVLVAWVGCVRGDEKKERSVGRGGRNTHTHTQRERERESERER